ncbi:MAG TPA: group 1 truncated hemoglobin [Lapillicoccus sp.]
MSATGETTDYERIGGGAAVSAVVGRFYAAVLADPALAPYFDGVEMTALRRHQVLLISQVMGGPVEYDGRELAQAHAGHNITDEAYDKVVDHLVAALKEAGVDDDVIGRLGQLVAGLRADIVTSTA